MKIGLAVADQEQPHSGEPERIRKMLNGKKLWSSRKLAAVAEIFVRSVIRKKRIY